MHDVALDPLVSVVLPVHDTSPGFLQEAIESVRRQTEARWELVVVLDAASRACARVAHDMASLDPARIRVVGEVGGAPRGLSGARNLGVSHSRAPVIGFLDADDAYEPGRLAERLARLTACPEAAMAYGPTLYWHSWEGHAPSANRKHDYVPDLGVEGGSVQPPPVFVLRFVSGRAPLPCTCSILVRRSAIEAVGGFEETFQGLYEDQVFYARVGSRFPVVVDDRVLDRYRQHPASMTARASREYQRQMRVKFLDWLEVEMRSADLDYEAIQRVIAHERWKLRHPALARLLRIPRKAANRLLPVTRLLRSAPAPTPDPRVPQ